MRALLVLALAGQVSAAPYVDPSFGYRLELPAGWALRVTGPSSSVRTFGPAGDPDVAVMVHVARVPKGTPLDVERIQRAAAAGIQGLNARSKPTEWTNVPVPGVKAVGWGYNFKPADGAVQAIRCAAFAVPAHDRELHVRVQASFQGAKVAVLKAGLPELLGSLKFAATAPEDQDLKLLVERERCLEDQRVMTSAVRRFAEQRHEKVTKVDTAALVAGKFLKNPPAEPWVLTPDGDVACAVHGDASGAVQGTAPRAQVPAPPLDYTQYRALTGEAAKRVCASLVSQLASGLALTRKNVDRKIELKEALATMTRRGWLASVMALEDPGQGAASLGNFSSKDGVVRCAVHGTASR